MEFVNQYVLPALDILLIAAIIYHGYRLLESTRAIQLIKGVMWLVIIFGIAFFLRLTTLLRIIDLFLPSVVIAIALVFQPELRQIVNRLGRKRILQFHFSKTKSTAAEPVITAVKQLVERQRGALIVFMRGIGLQNVINSGTVLDASVSSQLILTIFMHNTPLHDGAVIILDDKIVAAGCVLPLSVRDDAVINLGTRHRAGLGIAEESDAVALIVSEEKSSLSLAYDAQLYQGISIQELQSRLSQILVDGGAQDGTGGAQDGTGGAQDGTGGAQDGTAGTVESTEGTVESTEGTVESTEGTVESTEGTAGSTRTSPNDDSTPLESSAQDGTGSTPTTPGTAGGTRTSPNDDSTPLESSAQDGTGSADDA